MNSSVLKANVSHNNILNMRQCGQCIRCSHKNVTRRNLEPLETVNIIKQDIGDKKKFAVALTSCLLLAILRARKF